MTATRIDRRAARTGRPRPSPFVSLVQARGYGEVSVVDLCATADVGRSTFYAHYADKDDLKRRAMAEHLRAVVARGSDGVAADDPLRFSLLLLNHARDCLDLRRAGAGTAGERIAGEVLSEIVHGQVRNTLAGGSRTRPGLSAEGAVALMPGGWRCIAGGWPGARICRHPGWTRFFAGLSLWKPTRSRRFPTGNLQAIRNCEFVGCRQLDMSIAQANGGGIMDLTRRSTLIAGLSFGLAGAVPAWAESDMSIHVVKDPGCPCCNGWIGHLRDSGFDVSFEVRSVEDLAVFKRERGIPDDLVSCHTATIGGYTVEGHVPAADIRRLLAEKPAAIGLSVPGMVTGSPGMGPETEREAYDVILVGTDGSGSVFTSYPAA